jgi:hypothetical protein
MSTYDKDSDFDEPATVSTLITLQTIVYCLLNNGIKFVKMTGLAWKQSETNWSNI